MSWIENMSTDILSVDQQHQSLIHEMEAFFIRVHAGLDRPRLIDALDRLIELVAGHFAHEERVMRNIHLPALTVHEHLHRALLDEIREFREEVVMGANRRTAADIEHFLKDWLYRHIAEEDQKIFAHLNRP